MGQPITVTDGVCMSFPDVLMTPVPGSSPVPIPYPNIAQLSDASDTAASVNAGGKPVVVESSSISSSSGGEAGSNGGVTSGGQNGECTFSTASSTVFANGAAVVRMGDTTSQNDGNAVGTVLGGLPTVLVGG
ncbi:PAAR-like domain-containing protein [Meridianimarinicoccus sp. RP-17]|uniref:PAAR-like domain-containing protein n=1 Tax=Meridianimarinicoccus zhengii TaxID=2056810 RepID=UPI000DAE81BE|nr:PAAR-like domain-containing protein [Phycocomes zhengii]